MNRTTSQVQHPFMESLKCTLTSTKKTSYYNVTYQPPPDLRRLSELSLFGVDLSVRTGCCNCITFVLYWDGELKFNLYTYLLSIATSVDNIRKYLPTWVVRLYLDWSVYNHVSGTTELANECRKVFDELNNAPNVEVYTYTCPEYSGDNIGYTRAFRILPLIDPEVAAYAFREADGIVTAVDCQNLEWMVSKQVPLYLIPNTPFIPCLKRNNGSYSSWLNSYKEAMGDYYNINGNVVDLMAGVMAGQIKFQPSYYYSCVKRIFALGIDKSYIFGFDEILLLHLFRYVVCICFEKPRVNGYVDFEKAPDEYLSTFNMTNDRLRVLMRAYVSKSDVYFPEFDYMGRHITVDLKSFRFGVPQNYHCSIDVLKHEVNKLLNKMKTLKEKNGQMYSLSDTLIYILLDGLVKSVNEYTSLNIVGGTGQLFSLKDYKYGYAKVANNSHYTVGCHRETAGQETRLYKHIMNRIRRVLTYDPTRYYTRMQQDH